MKFVELTDEQRKMILDHVGSSVTDVYHEVNLNILTALYDEESDRYLTLSYYVSRVVTQDDDITGYEMIQGDSVGTYTDLYEAKDPVFKKMCRHYFNDKGEDERIKLEKKLLERYALTYKGEPVDNRRVYLQWYLKNKRQNGAE